MSETNLDRFIRRLEGRAKKIWEEWKRSNTGEPSPVGECRFFPIRLIDFVKKPDKPAEKPS